MSSPGKTPKHVKLDERNHVEKPLLDQLAGLGWEVIDLTDMKQTPADTHRESFAEVVMPPVLRERLKVINPWLEDDQVEEVVKQLTASFPSTGLLENNKHLFQLLLENTSVSENRQSSEKSPTVRFADFATRDNNRFIAVCQFKVRVLGTEHHIIPDVVLFLNGLPVVVIECKSPKVKDAIPEAIDQLLRYSEQRGAKGEGNAPLFYYNQFVVATCRQEAKFGTITTHTEKYFYRWADPYSRTVDELDHGSGSPNDQQRLVAGMLDRDNLLDLIPTFTLFSTNDKGQTIKIVGRYQQFRAVKLAVKRLIEGRNPRERSGIIWHTQGSGKSLTMMFMVREMYRHAQLFLEVEPLTGRRHVEVGERRTRRDWALWIQGMLRTRYPQAERVVLILDNINTHGIESLYEAFAPQEARTLAERLEIHYTPKHGQLATPFDGLGLRVNSRLTCPPTSWRVLGFLFKKRDIMREL